MKKIYSKIHRKVLQKIYTESRIGTGGSAGILNKLIGGCYSDDYLLVMQVQGDGIPESTHVNTIPMNDKDGISYDYGVDEPVIFGGRVELVPILWATFYTTDDSPDDITLSFITDVGSSAFIQAGNGTMVEIPGTGDWREGTLTGAGVITGTEIHIYFSLFSGVKGMNPDFDGYLSGTIPAIDVFPNLTSILIYGTHLSGSLPDPSSNTALEEYNLSYGDFAGAIPDFVNNAALNVCTVEHCIGITGFSGSYRIFVIFLIIMH
jgi:hypothetical protein